MARTEKYTDASIVETLRLTKGMVYLAAERLGCDAGTIFKRARKRPAVRAAIDAERGKVVDAAELKLFTGIMNGEPWAVQLCLKTLGRDRGYVERSERDVSGYVLVLTEEVIGDGHPAPQTDGEATRRSAGIPPE